MSRVLCIDHGIKRLGLALSDPLRITVKPLRVVERRSRAEDFAELVHILHEEDVEHIVVGLPTDIDARVGPQAATVIRWARKLAAHTDAMISFWDESYSSEEARRLVGGRDAIDDVAAAIILQDYLDSGGRDYDPGQPLAAFDHIE